MKVRGDGSQVVMITFQKFQLDWTTLKDIAFIRTDGFPEKAYSPVMEFLKKCTSMIKSSVISKSTQNGMKVRGDGSQVVMITFQKFQLDWTTLKDIAFIRTDGFPEKAYSSVMEFMKM
jgi:hypothetical protein